MSARIVETVTCFAPPGERNRKMISTIASAANKSKTLVLIHFPLLDMKLPLQGRPHDLPPTMFLARKKMIPDSVLGLLYHRGCQFSSRKVQGYLSCGSNSHVQIGVIE